MDTSDMNLLLTIPKLSERHGLVPNLDYQA